MSSLVSFDLIRHLSLLPVHVTHAQRVLLRSEHNGQMVESRGQKSNALN